MNFEKISFTQDFFSAILVFWGDEKMNRSDIYKD